MKNEEKIKIIDSLGILGDVRQRLGANDEADDSFDNRIVNMSANRIVETHIGWQLGDESWAREAINMYFELVNSGISKHQDHK